MLLRMCTQLASARIKTVGVDHAPPGLGFRVGCMVQVLGFGRCATCLREED